MKIEEVIQVLRGLTHAITDYEKGYVEELRAAKELMKKIDVGGFEFNTSEKVVEAEIAEEYVTRELVDMERAKIRQLIHDEEGLGAGLLDEVERTHRSKFIPRLLQTVFRAIVTEEMWTAVTQYKDPVIDFKLLRRHVIHQTKKHASDLI